MDVWKLWYGIRSVVWWRCKWWKRKRYLVWRSGIWSRKKWTRWISEGILRLRNKWSAWRTRWWHMCRWYVNVVCGSCSGGPSINRAGLRNANTCITCRRGSWSGCSSTCTALMTPHCLWINRSNIGQVFWKWGRFWCRVGAWHIIGDSSPIFINCKLGTIGDLISFR